MEYAYSVGVRRSAIGDARKDQQMKTPYQQHRALGNWWRDPETGALIGRWQARRLTDRATVPYLQPDDAIRAAYSRTDAIRDTLDYDGAPMSATEKRNRKWEERIKRRK